MNTRSILLCFTIVIAGQWLTKPFADNPIIQTCYTADPAPLVFNDRVYVYVGHDSSAAPNNSYLMRYYKCYSSADMVNWTDHGIVLKTSEFNGWR